MATATWNGTVLAESDDIVVVEGNAYFPRESVRDDVLRPSDTHTICPWKGTASYFSVEGAGRSGLRRHGSSVGWTPGRRRESTSRPGRELLPV